MRRPTTSLPTPAPRIPLSQAPDRQLIPPLERPLAQSPRSGPGWPFHASSTRAIRHAHPPLNNTSSSHPAPLALVSSRKMSEHTGNSTTAAPPRARDRFLVTPRPLTRTILVWTSCGCPALLARGVHTETLAGAAEHPSVGALAELAYHAREPVQTAQGRHAGAHRQPSSWLAVGTLEQPSKRSRRHTASRPAPARRAEPGASHTDHPEHVGSAK